MVQGCWYVAGMLAVVMHVGGAGIRAETVSSVDLDELCATHSTYATKSQRTVVCQIQDEQGPLGLVAPKPPQDASRLVAENAAALMSTVDVRGSQTIVEHFVFQRCDQRCCETLELVRIYRTRVFFQPKEEYGYHPN